jgi:hypothetical protein
MPLPGAASIVNPGPKQTAYVLFFDQYVGAGGSGAPTYQNALGYLNADGYANLVFWDLWENNVAGSGAIIIEGADRLALGTGSAGSFGLWQPVGYYPLVANGTTATTLTRVQGTAVTLTQNTFTRLQVLDFYQFYRARVTSNASSASLSAAFYAIP